MSSQEEHKLSYKELKIRISEFYDDPQYKTIQEKRDAIRKFYEDNDFDEDALFKRYRILKFDCDIWGQTLYSGAISVIISLAVSEADFKFTCSDIMWVNNLLSFVWFLLCSCFLAGSILLLARFFLHGCMSKDTLLIKPTELKIIDKKIKSNGRKANKDRKTIPKE